MTIFKKYNPNGEYKDEMYIEAHEYPDMVSELFYIIKLQVGWAKINSKRELQHLLKAICQALIGDKREDLTEDEVLLANRAGYTVKDSSSTDFSLVPPFNITSTNGENEPEQPVTVTITTEEHERLLADSRKLAAIKGELEGEA